MSKYNDTNMNILHIFILYVNVWRNGDSLRRKFNKI